MEVSVSIASGQQQLVSLWPKVCRLFPPNDPLGNVAVGMDETFFVSSVPRCKIGFSTE